MNEKKTPRIRFKGFTDDWEQRKLGELMMIIGGNAWKSEDYSDTGNYLVVTIANVNGRYFIDDSFGNRIDVDNPGVYLLRKNDILISLTGNVGRVSKMTEIPAVLNQRVAKVVVDRANIDNEFIYQILSSFRFENAMIKAGQGAAQSNISNSNVKEYSAFMPNSRSEQAEIGAVFKHLDNLITLHQRKYEKLQIIKKLMLENCFPKNGEKVPKIRFSGFTGDWEQRKLGELMMIIGGNAWKSEDYSDTGNYLVVTIANVNGRYFIDDSFGNRIDVDNPGVYLLRKNDILISLTGNVGRVSKMTEIPAVLNQRVAKVVVDRANIDNEFIYQILSSFRFENAMIKAGQGAAQSNISNSNVKEYSAFMPNSRSEQAEIGAVFKHLDNLITLHQSKAEKLQKIKKSLLERMFA